MSSIATYYLLGTRSTEIADDLGFENQLDSGLQSIRTKLESFYLLWIVNNNKIELSIYVMCRIYCTEYAQGEWEEYALKKRVE